MTLKNNISKTILILVGVGTVLFWGLFLMIMNDMKSSEAYHTAKEYVAQDPEVLEKIGRVDGYGFWVTGELTENRSAILKFTINGEKDSKLNAVVSLEKETEGWAVIESEYQLR